MDNPQPERLLMYVNAQTIPDAGRHSGMRNPDTHCALLEPVSGGATAIIETPRERIVIMLYTIALVLVILWLLGLVTSTTMGGFVHVLLVIAIVVILLRVIDGRKVL